jgi:hypothetical protein
LAGWGNGAEAEARDGGGAGVRTHLECAENLGRRGCLVTESKDEDSGLDLFGREQVEAAGLLSELDLCSGRGGERNIGQSVAKRGIAFLIEGGKPAIEEAAGGGVGDEPHLVAESRQTNKDGGVNGADVVSPACGHRSVGGITEDDRVDLGWIIFLVSSRGGSGCAADGTGSAGVEMCMFGVTQGIEDRGERSDGGYGSEQDRPRAERLAAGDIEGGSGQSGDAGVEGLLHGWSLGVPRVGRVVKIRWIGRYWYCKRAAKGWRELMDRMQTSR